MAEQSIAFNYCQKRNEVPTKPAAWVRGQPESDADEIDLAAHAMGARYLPSGTEIEFLDGSRAHKRIHRRGTWGVIR